MDLELIKTFYIDLARKTHAEAEQICQQQGMKMYQPAHNRVSYRMILDRIQNLVVFWESFPKHQGCFAVGKPNVDCNLKFQVVCQQK